MYLETTKYYRYQRTQDIQAMENRSGGNNNRFGAQDLAESIWHSLPEAEKGASVPEWIKSTFRNTGVVEIPEGKPEALGASDMFNPTTVIFRGDKDTHQISYASPEQAELVSKVARMGVRGLIAVPKSPSDCHECLKQLDARLSIAQERFAEMAALRTGTHLLQEKTSALLMHWYVHGKSPISAKTESGFKAFVCSQNKGRPKNGTSRLLHFSNGPGE